MTRKTITSLIPKLDTLDELKTHLETLRGCASGSCSYCSETRYNQMRDTRSEQVIKYFEGWLNMVEIKVTHDQNGNVYFVYEPVLLELRTK